MITEDGYYVILIIITIIGFILIISFAFYFLYIPSIRINSIIQDTVDRGNNAIEKGTELENQVSLTNKQVQALYIGFCNLNSDKDTVLFGFFITVGSAWSDTFDEFCENLNLEIPS